MDITFTHFAIHKILKRIFDLKSKMIKLKDSLEDYADVISNLTKNIKEEKVNGKEKS